MNHGSLFSGIGGFDLASEWMGWNNVFHCEWNSFGKKVLNYYWPESISYEDITKTDFTKHRGSIDILTGGFPCQPYSSAGKRLGKEDDRHLWPEMLRAIREIQPRYIVGENVYGLTNWNGGLVFNEVQVDLENEGYKVQPCILPACAVNAPHRRDRVWFIALNAKCQSYGRYNTRKSKGKGVDLEGNSLVQKRRNESTDYTFTPNNSRTTANTRSDINSPQGESSKTEGTRCERIEKTKERGERSQRPDGLPGFQGDASYSCNERLQGRELNGASDKEAKKQREQPSRSATERHQITDWKQWPTQSPICSGDDGLSNQLDGITFPKWRQESIKAYGNAIVPQVAYQIFKAIALYEQ